MTKEEFRKLFEKHITKAIEYSEKVLNTKLPTKLRIAFTALGYQYNSLEDTIDIAETLELLYLGEDKFFAIINIGVRDIIQDTTIMWVTPTGHRPREFDKTWNIPPGSGPFKVVGPSMDLHKIYTPELSAEKLIELYEKYKPE